MPSCPTTSTLREFAAGRLIAADESCVLRHLDECVHCQATLSQLDVDHVDAVSFDPSPIQSSERLRRMLDEVKRQAPQRLLSNDNLFVGDLEPWLTAEASTSDGARVDGHILKQCLGRGGMGVVFLAFDTKLRRQVAFKFMTPGLLADPSSAARFQREAHSAAAINHPNVVTIHTVGVFRQLPYLVMELVQGETLGDRMQRERLSAEHVFGFALQIANGLAAAHAAGVHHRDIKPSNILLQAGTGLAKLTDFGLAKTSEDDSLTRTGMMVGTPDFMAPEQFEPSIGEVDHRSDLFSLGSLIYAMWTDSPPFRSPSAIATLNAVCTKPHPPLRGTTHNAPTWFIDLVDQLLAKCPGDRPQSADAVARAFATRSVPQNTNPAVRGSPKRHGDLTGGNGSPVGSNFHGWAYPAVACLAGVLLACLFFFAKRNAGTVSKELSQSAQRTNAPPGRLASDQKDALSFEDPDEAGEPDWVDVDDSDRLFELLFETEGHLRIRLSSGEFEIPSFQFESRSIEISGSNKDETRIVINVGEDEVGIRAVDSRLQLNDVAVEFIWYEDNRVQEQSRLCIAMEGGEFLASSIRLECEVEAGCLGLIASESVILDTDIIVPNGVAVLWMPDFFDTLRIENSVIASHVQMELEGLGLGEIELRRNSLLGEINFEIAAGAGSTSPSQIIAERNIFYASDVSFRLHGLSDDVGHSSPIRWRGAGNQFPTRILIVDDEFGTEINKIDQLDDLSNLDWFQDSSSEQSNLVQGVNGSRLLQQMLNDDLDTHSIRGEKLRTSVGAVHD
ncbi:MAG: serine/threonine-protein kinase [Planctomycetota bacterium]